MYGYEASGSGRIGASRSTKTVRKPSSSTTWGVDRPARGCVRVVGRLAGSSRVLSTPSRARVVKTLSRRRQVSLGQAGALASPRATGCFASAPSTRCFSCPRERPKEREEPSVAPVAERKAPGSTPPKRTPAAERKRGGEGHNRSESAKRGRRRRGRGPARGSRAGTPRARTCY